MKKILLFAPEENERTKYLYSVLGSRYELTRCDTVDGAIAKLGESSHEIAAVIVDSPSNHPSADLLIAHVGGSNSYMMAIPVLALTDEDNRKHDALLLSDTVTGVIETGEDERIVCHRIEMSIDVVNSASFNEFSGMLKALPSLVYLKDTNGRYVFCSQIWHHLDTGGDPDWTIRGKTDMDIRKDKDNARKAYESDLKIVATDTGTSYIIREEQDGITEYLQLIKEPVHDEEGRVKGIIAIINNVTEQELLRQELKNKSITDEMTGLFNRTYYYEYIEIIPEDAYPLSFISADCDGLKSVNDNYGHLAGDEYIRMSAAMMKNVLPEDAAVFRMGGDEFLAVLPHTDEEKVAGILKELGDHEKIFSIRDRTLSVSFGSCTVHVPSDSISECLARSDAEMYKAKKKKKEQGKK